MRAAGPACLVVGLYFHTALTIYRSQAGVRARVSGGSGTRFEPCREGEKRHGYVPCGCVARVIVGSADCKGLHVSAASVACTGSFAIYSDRSAVASHAQRARHSHSELGASTMLQICTVDRGPTKTNTKAFQEKPAVQGPDTPPLSIVQAAARSIGRERDTILRGHVEEHAHSPQHRP